MRPKIAASFWDFDSTGLDRAGQRLQNSGVTVKSVIAVEARNDDWFWPVFQMYGSDASLAAIAEEWLHHGVTLVAITRGRKEVLLFARDRMPMVVVPPPVPDTVGAEDAFLAGFLAFLSHGGNLARWTLANASPLLLHGALEFACQVAARACERSGAAMLFLDDILPGLHATRFAIS